MDQEQDLRRRIEQMEAQNGTLRRRVAELESLVGGELRQSQKMEALGTLAGGIAHDFNNILATIIGFTELALDEIPPESDLYANLLEVLLSGRRGRDLVRQILAFSRRTDEEKQPVQVDPLIRETVKMLRASLPSSIEIREDVPRVPVTVLAEPTQIHQILTNLATNAADAMSPEGGTLAISLGTGRAEDLPTDARKELSGKAYMRLVVSDTGAGIRAEDRERIFEPYYTRKSLGKGTGLGLAMVHGIVKGCRGWIDLQSEPGKGSTFAIYLPLIDHKEAAPAPAPETDLPTGTEHVLLLDDEQSIVRMLRSLLEQLGYRVTARYGPEKALADFRQDPGRFDAVITDMTMPKLSGDRLARQIKRIRSDVPVILCTGYSARIDEEKARSSGIDGFLTKPMERVQVAVTLRRVLDAVKRP